MKRLTQWIKRKLRREPNIPEKVRQQINSVSSLITIYRSEIKDKATWNFKVVIDEYIHKNILWKTGTVNGNGQISPIQKADAEQLDNILLQRVLWGERPDAYFYGVMSFIKCKKKWYFVNSQIIQQVSKIPTFDDCYAYVTGENGKTEMAAFKDMRELFFQYEAE